MQPLPTSRVDERDTMFARMARRPGTPAFDEFYARHPNLKPVDDRIRARPDLCEPGGLHHDPEIAREARDWFSRIPNLEPDPEVTGDWARRIQNAKNPAKAIRRMFLRLGAVAAGFAPIPEEYVYTRRGRHDADYGKQIDLDHPTAVVFLVEMDHGAMRHAPFAETIRESAHQYHRAARISIQAAAVLREAGWAAQANLDARYDVILPPLAVLAGLGELGRNNILLAPRYGSRVRIAAVTTDAPVPHDRPVAIGAARFCEICKKCADNCPSHALSTGERSEVRGIRKWPTNVERCYGYWRRVGTDCGICMACCPFSHRNNAFHNLVRLLVRWAPWLHRLLKWGDDVTYGREWKPAGDRRVGE